MKLKVTFMNEKDSKDYVLNDDISIKKALEIIRINDQFQTPYNMQYVFSKRQQECISVNLSFQQAGIYSGDILKTISDGGRKK